MKKKIYFEPTGRMHSAYKEIISYPPQGYEFVTGQGLWDKTTEGFLNSDFVYFTLSRFIRKLIPIHLFKPYLERFKKIPEGIDLTFSAGHLIFRKEPWVVEFEWVIQFAWFSMKYLERYKRLIEDTLASDYCKKIICWTELTKKTVLWNLDCTGFEHKLETVYRVVHGKNFTKTYDGNKIKLLFMGSANILGEFEEKGGKEALETFTLLNKNYDNLEFIIRSDVPQSIKKKYSQYNNVRIIDKAISWEELEQEFKSADILLLPAHHTPSMTFLDAMSYELPVVTIDSWANSEIVEDGKTGFVVTQPDGFQLPVADFLPAGRATPVNVVTRAVDPRVVEDLAEKTSILIENQELRGRMGKAGRWEVEHGKFSIENRNEKLKRIFDEATA